MGFSDWSLHKLLKSYINLEYSKVKYIFLVEWIMLTSFDNSPDDMNLFSFFDLITVPTLLIKEENSVAKLRSLKYIIQCFVHCHRHVISNCCDYVWILILNVQLYSLNVHQYWHHSFGSKIKIIKLPLQFITHKIMSSYKKKTWRNYFVKSNLILRNSENPFTHCQAQTQMPWLLIRYIWRCGYTMR